MISIIYVTWSMNEFRSALMRRSIQSIVDTCPDEQILVADNGGSLDDSQLLLKLCDDKKIAAYLRFRQNLHFAYARNTLLKLATEPYICICDNDIVVEEGWWQECVAFLEKNPDLIATPLVPDLAHRSHKFWLGERDGWQLNSRAGSPCFVMKRELFEKIGDFPLHNKAGSIYCDRLVRAGAVCAVMPQCKAIDLGERRGYNWRAPDYSTTL